MDLFPLQLFPEGALDSSVITTVWVGVFVVATLNLRLGWVLSGLVVPGYLVPLLIARPISAGVVVAEAILTYLIVIALAGPLARVQGWGSFFGRDRFFALVLVSVVVRLVLDAWLLPIFGQWLDEVHGLEFDYRNTLHSFGLIIIALIANQFWKTGLVRGMVPLVVTVGISFLIVRYGLMELTNFRISGLSYMFEDVTASILASPKAYIILLTTAFVASRMNLFYGWEFNGILIPSLLALQWYEPGKILISFAEAFLILGIGTALMRLPAFRNANIEGGRKLLLFFNIAFAWKMLLSYALLAFAPAVKISDYFAFGYLLSTLMAIKMHDKAIAVRLTWSTVTTSLVAIVIASVLGFALTLMPRPGSTLAANIETAAAPRASDASLVDAIAAEKRRAYGDIGRWVRPLPAELELFRDAIGRLEAVRSVDDTRVVEATRDLASIDIEVVVLESRHLLLRDRRSGRGWGTFVVTPGAASRALIEAPAPIHEPATTEAALWLKRSTDARAFALGGARRQHDRDAPVAVLSDRDTLFHLFHRTFDDGDVIQVRGYRPTLRRAVSRTRDAVVGPDAVWVSGALPPSLDLGALRERIGALDVRFTGAPEANRLRTERKGGFAELILERPALRRLAAGLAGSDEPLAVAASHQRIEGYLQDWLFGDTPRIAPRGSGPHRTPDLFELLYLDEEILTPLHSVLETGYRDGRWTDEGLEVLSTLARQARGFGYRLLRFRHIASGNDYLILGMRPESGPASDSASGTASEPASGPAAGAVADPPYWGTYVFRPGPAQPVAVQVPRPEFERGSAEFGIHLFERVQARSLSIAGTHPRAELDGSTDVTRARARQSLFNLVSQVQVREAGATGLSLVQARALVLAPEVPAPAADLVVTPDRGVTEASALRPASRRVLDRLRDDGLTLQFERGDPETAGLSARRSFQSQYLRASEHSEFMILWLSPFARDDFARRDADLRLQRDMRSLDISSERAALGEWLAARALGGTAPTARERELLGRYAQRDDLVALAALVETTGARGVQQIFDIESRQAFLALLDGDRVRAVARLAPGPDLDLRGAADTLRADVDRLRDRRAAWLTFGDGGTP